MTWSSHKTVVLHPGSKLTLLTSFMCYHLICLLPGFARNGKKTSSGSLNFVVYLMQEKKVWPNSWSPQPSILMAEVCLHLVNKINFFSKSL